MNKRIPAIFTSVLLVLNFSACNYMPAENSQDKIKQSSSEMSNSSNNVETLLNPNFSSFPFLCVAEGSDPLTDDEIRSMIRDLPGSQYETYPDLHNVPITATLYKDDEVISVDIDDTRLVSLINFYNNSVYHHQYSYTQGFLSIDYLETNVLNEDFRLVLTFATKNNAPPVSYDTEIQTYDTMVITNECFVLIGHDLPGYEDSEDRYPFASVGHIPLYNYYCWLDLFGF